MCEQVNMRVVQWERTWTIYPCQWQGTLADGHAIYIHYRRGIFRFGIGADLDDAIEHCHDDSSRRSNPHGEYGGAFLADSLMIDEMRKFGVSFQNAARIGVACEDY
jgi:hypothetical protein